MPSPSTVTLPAPQEPWRRVWESKGGVWYGLSESEFKVFPLEQLARNWGAGKQVAA